MRNNIKVLREVVMFSFACPACSSRIVMCVGKNVPVVSRCPGCSVLLAFIHEQRSLLDKIRDAWTPTDLVKSVND